MPGSLRVVEADEVALGEFDFDSRYMVAPATTNMQGASKMTAFANLGT